MPRPHSHAGEYSSEVQCVTDYGIFQREKQSNDIRQAYEFKVQVWQQAILVQRILCDTVGRNKKAIAEYIRNQLQEDIASDQITLKEYIDLFTGDKNTKA